MWWIAIVGLVLVVAGGVCVHLAVRARRRVHAMTAAETLTVPELERLRAVSDELGARGSFRRVAEVVGQAAPGVHGPLTSELTGTESVWHGYRVQRHYEDRDTDGDGDTRVTRRTETVAEYFSGTPFRVARDGRAITVDPGPGRVDGAETVTDRFEATRGQRSGWAGFVRVVGLQDDATLGHQYTEWVVRPGTPLYVLGEVRDATGELVIGPPGDPKQHFVVSTSTEEELTARDRRRQELLSRIGAGLAAGGVVLAALAPVL